MLHLIARVIDSQDSILCDFLLDSKEPVSGIWIFGIRRKYVYALVCGKQRRIRRGVGDGWDCAAEDGEIEEGVRDGCIGRHVIRQGIGGGLHGHIEQAAVAVNHRLSLAKDIPGEA